MSQPCPCCFCRGDKAPAYSRTRDELLEVIENRRDDRHRLVRVMAYIELFYRCGECDPEMPYRVWQAVFGEHVPPPTTFGVGAFPLVPDHARYFFGTKH